MNARGFDFEQFASQSPDEWDPALDERYENPFALDPNEPVPTAEDVVRRRRGKHQRQSFEQPLVRLRKAS